ncbi:MAG: hypothetical protein ACXWQ5_12065 [Ktedonobacterales bacterium]
MDYVVRAGVATADFLQNGYTEHLRAPGIYGFSVQYAPGKNKTLRELAVAGGFRNGKISYASAEELLTCLQPLGYAMRLFPTPGHGYHHTLCVVYDANGIALQVLPRDAAEAISNALQRMPNPALQP